MFSSFSRELFVPSSNNHIASYRSKYILRCGFQEEMTLSYPLEFIYRMGATKVTCYTRNSSSETSILEFVKYLCSSELNLHNVYQYLAVSWKLMNIM
nr:hypothetical protein BgiMline_021051 [Biomphalaria glabrata]